eukprot:2978440-Rhodomonas_salina.1
MRTRHLNTREEKGEELPLVEAFEAQGYLPLPSQISTVNGQRSTVNGQRLLVNQSAVNGQGQRSWPARSYRPSRPSRFSGTLAGHCQPSTVNR